MCPARKHSSQQQETLILEAAINCIEESSLLDFTMAAISKEAGLSMGSVYKHVQSKEDVLVALATRMNAHQLQVFEALMNLPLTTPERLISFTLVSPERVHLYSFGVHLEMLIGNEAVLRRASTRWLETLIRIDQSIEAVFKDALNQAWISGELMVADKDSVRIMEMLGVGLWSMSVGFKQVAYQQQTRHLVDMGAELPFPVPTDHAIVESTRRLINTFPWKTPLDDKGIAKACALLEERGYREVTS